VLWISGDTVLYRGVRHVAARLRVDIVLLHLGGMGFPVTGPLRYTMTAREAIRLCGLVHPRSSRFTTRVGRTSSKGEVQ
jgi:hypothetical protein